MVVPTRKLLSCISRDQAAKLKELEADNEEVIDENCWVFSEYFKEVLRDKDRGRSLESNPPSVVLERKGKDEGDKLEKVKGGQSKTGEQGPKNTRYNVMLSL